MDKENYRQNGRKRKWEDFTPRSSRPTYQSRDDERKYETRFATLAQFELFLSKGGKSFWLFYHQISWRHNQTGTCVNRLILSSRALLFWSVLWKNRGNHWSENWIKIRRDFEDRHVATVMKKTLSTQQQSWEQNTLTFSLLKIHFFVLDTQKLLHFVPQPFSNQLSQSVTLCFAPSLPSFLPPNISTLHATWPRVHLWTDVLVMTFTASSSSTLPSLP